ncbi:HIT-type Zinc finger family protein isoform 1 [Hibiscus syriacus]|uniref:HIT-type Zinc finger family protein isoform 1 n=1 Tax=Hibiscus syriacus TaxID=106335 RepID=A0A6A2WJL0_HIBSY|nr:cation/H(+) antiporter 24-like [Hibiscus syriacus]KAE8658731.1 HIT-type Zinc finger family protein isoform 1 [Hibiscus syriacus]
MGITTGAKFQTSNRGTAAYPLMCYRSQVSNPYSIFYGGKPVKFSFNVILVSLILTILFSRSLHFLLKPLRQCRFVSQLLGGIILGPSLMAQSPMFVSMVFPLTSDFLLKNLGIMGLMLFLFVSGVKMDMGLLKRSGKKQLCIALPSVFIPLAVASIVGFSTRKSMDADLQKVASIEAIALSLSVTAFPIHYTLLEELNLLSSEVGNMAMSTTIISDTIALNFMVAFGAMKQNEVSLHNAILYMISSVVFTAFLAIVVRRLMLWIIQNTTDGEPVDQFYVIVIFLSAFVLGFITDMIDLAICIGSFWLGMVIPDGPPLGATLVEKSETIIMEIILPCSFTYIGFSTDFYAMKEASWSALSPLLGLFISGYLSKVISTMLASKMVGLSWRDSFAMGLILSMRGHAELILYVHWVDKDIIGVPGFSMMVFGTVILMGIHAPLISILYDPSKPYMVNQRRTIQHTAPNDYLRILVCIKDKRHLPSLVNLLQVSYPTVQNPFSIHVFHLVELIGRANPLFIDHQNQELKELVTRFPDWGTIHHALNLYQEGKEDCVDLQFLSTSTTKATMYQDVCKLALISKSVIIILPLEKKYDGEIATTEEWGGGNQSVIIQVLENAPCSVGLLVEKAERWQLPQKASFSFIVLFLGGPDSREALSYSSRMAENPRVSLTVIRFLSGDNEGDDELQKKMDDGVMTSFWVQNEGNDRVSYRELVVRNGADTVAAILEMAKENYYDMWIVGRKQEINPSLLEGLSTWTENQEELGIIGDYVSSADSVNGDSVLVIQKQVLSAKGPNNKTTSTIAPVLR